MTTQGPIVITGFMGCGKTDVARELARQLNVPVVDLDEKIAQDEGKTAAQLIVERGEPAFRSVETNALRELLASRAAGVIALGGGAWISEVNRNLIDEHHGLSVWLDTLFEICWERIENAEEDRPLGRTRAQAEELYKLRRPAYQLANIRLEIAADEGIESVVARVKAELQVEHG